MANYAGSAIIGLQVQDQTKSGMSRLKPAFSRAGRESGRAFGGALNSAIDSSMSLAQINLQNIAKSATGLFTTNPARMLDSTLKLGETIADSLTKGITRGLKANQKSVGEMIQQTIFGNGNKTNSPASIQNRINLGGGGNWADRLQTVTLAKLVYPKSKSSVLSTSIGASKANRRMLTSMVPWKYANVSGKEILDFWKGKRNNWSSVNAPAERMYASAWREYRNLPWYQKLRVSRGFAEKALAGQNTQVAHFNKASEWLGSVGFDKSVGLGLPETINVSKVVGRQFEYLNALKNYRLQRQFEKKWGNFIPQGYTPAQKPTRADFNLDKIIFGVNPFTSKFPFKTYWQKKRSIDNFNRQSISYGSLADRIKGGDNIFKRWFNNPKNVASLGSTAIGVGIAGSMTALVGVVTTTTISFKAFQTALSFAIDSIKTFAQTEKSLNETVAILNSSGKLSEGLSKDEAVKSLKDAIYEASKKSVLTSAEMSDIANQYSRAGRSREEIEKALSPTANFAVATGLASVDATSLLADVQMAYGFDAKEMGYVADKMVAAITGSNMNAQQLLESMKASVAVAKTSNVSFDNLLKSIMQLADVNIKGGMANTVLRNVYMREGANKNAVSALGRLGFSYDDVQGLDVMSYVYKVTNKMLELGWSREERLKGYNELFGMYGISAGSLYDPNSPLAERIKKYEDSMANFYGSTSTIASSKMEGWVGSIEKFKAQLDVCKTIIGDTFGTRLSKWTQNIVQTDLPRYFKAIENASVSLVGKLGGGKYGPDDTLRGMYAQAQSTPDYVKSASKYALLTSAIASGMAFGISPLVALNAEGYLEYTTKQGDAIGVKWTEEDVRNIRNELSAVVLNLKDKLGSLNADITSEEDYNTQRDLIAAFRETLSNSVNTAQEGLNRIQAFADTGAELTPELKVLKEMFESNKYSCSEMSKAVEETSVALEKNIDAIRKEEEARNRNSKTIVEQTQEEKDAMNAGWNEIGRWSEENRPRSTPEKYDLRTPAGYHGFTPEEWQNGVAENWFNTASGRIETLAQRTGLGPRYADWLRGVDLSNNKDTFDDMKAFKKDMDEFNKKKKKSDEELDYRRKLRSIEKRSAREMKEMAKQYQKEADEKDLQHQEELAQIQADQAENISGSLGGIGDLIGSNFGYISNKEFSKAQVRYDPGTSVSIADVSGMLRDYGTADPRKVARMQTMENIQDMVMAKQQQAQMWYEYLDAITQAGVTNKMTIDSLIAREMTLDASNATFTIDKFSVGESLRMSVGKIEGGVNIPEVDNVSFGEGDADSLDTLNNIVEVITEFKDNSQKYFDEQSKPVQV